MLLQFTLQWIYAPLWIAALVALFALLLWSGGGGPSAPNSDAWLKVNRTFIPPRRLKAELTGKPEDWERYVTPILERRIRDAEQKHAFGAGDVAEDFSRVMHVKLAVRLYRGLGAAGVVRIAERYGWHGGASDEGRVRVRRVFPAPAPVAVPGPLDPPAAPVRRGDRSRAGRRCCCPSCWCCRSPTCRSAGCSAFCCSGGATPGRTTGTAGVPAGRSARAPSGRS
ncbi:hypothetical protein ACFQ0M_24190 [Kitasatospora aburaviensis]